MDAKRSSNTDAGVPAKRSSVAALLLAWYDAHRRDLPWRAKVGATPDPYRVWLSEVMLQQTTVATVRPRFEAWLARWPDLASLAAAEEAEVMAAWAGLGYYARARNLVRAARALVDERGGAWPTTEAELRALPGLGAYTAAAVAAIAFGQRAVVVDANVERVVARLFALADKRQVRGAADTITPRDRAGDFAQGLMDLGSAICRPKAPLCLLCPLRAVCDGYASGTPEAFPAKKTKKPKPKRYGTVFALLAPLPAREGPGVGRSSRAARVCPPTPDPSLAGRGVECDDLILLTRRPPSGLLGGMRALPTGPWADTPPGLADAPAAADWRLLPVTVAHGFTHFDLELALAVARAPAQGEGEWWPLATLATAGLPTVFAKAAAAIRSELCVTS